MSMQDAFNEDEMAEMADEHIETEEKKTSTLCPLSGRPVEEYETAFHFPGRVDAAFPKVLCGRTMSPDDYSRVLQAGDAGVEFAGFRSKTKNKEFTARVRFAPNRVFRDSVAPGVEMFFAEPKKTDTKCPISGQLVEEGTKSFRFPGDPSYRAWKEVAGRKMTAEDHATILEAKGTPVKFDGFKSRKTGRVFSAGLALRNKSGEKDGKKISWKEAAFDFGED